MLFNLSFVFCFPSFSMLPFNKESPNLTVSLTVSLTQYDKAGGEIRRPGASGLRGGCTGGGAQRSPPRKNTHFGRLLRRNEKENENHPSLMNTDHLPSQNASDQLGRGRRRDVERFRTNNHPPPGHGAVTNE